MLAHPRERRVEAVARDEEGNVVERRTCRLSELEDRLPDTHRHPTCRRGRAGTDQVPVERGELRQQRSGSSEPEVTDLHRRRRHGVDSTTAAPLSSDERAQHLDVVLVRAEERTADHGPGSHPLLIEAGQGEGGEPPLGAI